MTWATRSEIRNDRLHLEPVPPSRQRRRPSLPVLWTAPALCWTAACLLYAAAWLTASLTLSDYAAACAGAGVLTAGINLVLWWCVRVWRAR